MKILGIDTGGTYTDGVIIHADTKEILYKAKTLTTKNNLRVCITNCIQAFAKEALEDIVMVCLSTTIATNAIVESHGCKEGLILIGGKPGGKMPTEQYRIIQGRTDIRGRVLENIDSEEVDCAIEFFRNKVDALAISGYASVRNPQHELYVKQRVQEKLGIPVVCAHDLTTSLGYYDRTVTADLNAKLIPMVCDLIDSVSEVLKQYNIHASLMIVKGDGTLMTEAQAKDKPIETILSGPAASIMGGKFLSKEENAIILDMGGTTTDLANVSGGRMKVRREGAKVGGWFTRIQAAEVYTVGLGGDSRIFLDCDRNIKVGPQKATSLCMMGKWFPGLREELLEIYQDEKKRFLHFWKNESEAYLVVRKFEHLEYTDDEKLLMDALHYQPHTLYHLQKNVEMDCLTAKLEKLVQEGVITRIALTPTDILHSSGIYTEWDAEIAWLGLHIMSEQLGVTPEECIVRVCTIITKMLRDACIQGAFYFDGQDFEITSDDAADYFVNHVFSQDGSNVIGGDCFLKKKIVAIGAPVKAWVGGIEKELHTPICVPENAEVANAVGAAVGQQIQTAEILIRPDPVTKMYTVFTQNSRENFYTLDEATEYAKTAGEGQTTAHLLGKAYEITAEIEDICVDNTMEHRNTFVERQVRVSAIAQICT